MRWVIGVAAMKCKGYSTNWVNAGQVLPAPPPITWQPLLAFSGWVPDTEAAAEPAKHIPPDPPPRFAQL